MWRGGCGRLRAMKVVVMGELDRNMVGYRVSC